MPKNIYLPKENIPKIAEIREIENQITTYEEFVKTYRVDQEINNSYENELGSYGDIGTSKGYGPCYVCYKDTQWTDLYMGCPAVACDNTTTSNWYHSNSGYLLASNQHGCGTLEISNKGSVKCRSCGTASDIKNWNFSCSNHRGEDYRQTNSNSFLRSLGWVLMMSSNNEVIRDLSVYMSEHRW